MGGAAMIVVDTHVIVWDALKPELLSQQAKEALLIANNEDGIIFCEISLWEIAMLIQKGRLSVGISYREFMRLVLASNQYVLQGITVEIADRSTQFSSNITKDPADRIIAATAIVANATLVTADKNLRTAKGIPTIW
jgi:PIN domain nuclease of toxin-antitoxin system